MQLHYDVWSETPEGEARYLTTKSEDDLVDYLWHLETIMEVTKYHTSVSGFPPSIPLSPDSKYYEEWLASLNKQ